MLDKILDFIYPNSCILCGRMLNEYDVKKQEFTCNNCKKKLEYYLEDSCVKRISNKYFDYLLCTYKYNSLIRKILLDFKFYNKKYLRLFLSSKIIKVLKSINYKKYDYVVPVPISFARYLERGYNQSSLVAFDISKSLGIPMFRFCLIKIKNNKRQSELLAHERYNNTKGVYRILNSKLVSQKRIILIDDIYTTGNTANECSRVLKEAGASEVLVVVVARA